MSLDEDLAAWAATVRLPDADAAAILRRIVDAPVPTGRLDPSWWGRFTADFAARMIANTRPPRPAT